MHNWLYVFFGGGLGSLFRYGIGKYFANVTILPFGTFIANILACFLLGTLLAMEVKQEIHQPQLLLLATGFCGGFSTFSTFSAEALFIGRDQHMGWALLYIGISVIFGLLAIYLGYKVRYEML